jgi:glyoxylase-like metal-dependent hydrolase (beta-lactamase superfamily II)
MIIERTMNPRWLSNSYLVGDEPGGHAVFIDTGGPPEPLLEQVESLRLQVTHILCTHHHGDHVIHNAALAARFGTPICAHPDECSWLPGVELELGHGEIVRSGGLEIEALHLPGHTAGQLGFLVNGEEVFTGDTLFRGTVGGTRAPGHTSFEDLQHSIMEILMKLPGATRVHPGHTDPTSIGDEWERNPFIRAWRGVDPVRESRCTAFGRPATLLLRAPDYDGGTKCWVRFDGADGTEIVPGSQVRDL